MRIIHFLSVLILCFTFSITYAQQQDNKKKQPPGYKGAVGNIAVFMNTLSVLELQQGAIGAGVNYKLHPRWDLSLELNYLFEGFAQDWDDYESRGYRAILHLKRFSKSGLFFYGLDTRIKHFSFVDEQNFFNKTTNDTLSRFQHDASNTLFGVAGIVGLRLPISKNKKWAFEINTGIGTKYRMIKRENIPGGYKYLRPTEQPRHPNVSSQQDVDGWNNGYFPSAIRIMYFF